MLKQLPPLLLATLTLITSPALVAQIPSTGIPGNGIVVNYSGRDTVILRHPLANIIQAQATVLSGGQEIARIEPLQPDFIVFTGLPEDESLTIEVSGTFRDEFDDIVPFSFSTTGTLGPITGTISQGALENDTMTWTGERRLLDRVTISEGVTLIISPGAAIRSDNTQFASSRADIIVSGGELRANGAFFENLDEINCTLQNGQEATLEIRFEDCLFVAERFQTDVIIAGYTTTLTDLTEGDVEGDLQFTLIDVDQPTINNNDLPRSAIELEVGRDTSFEIAGNTFSRIEAAPSRAARISVGGVNSKTPVPVGGLSIVNNQISGRSHSSGPSGIFVEQLDGLIGVSFNSIAGTTTRRYNIELINLGESEGSVGVVNGNTAVSALILGAAPDDPVFNIFATENEVRGIQLLGSRNTISQNEVISSNIDRNQRSGTGMSIGTIQPGDVTNSVENTIEENRIAGFQSGVEFGFANRNTFERNTVESNTVNLALNGNVSNGLEQAPTENMIFDNIFRASFGDDGVNFELRGICLTVFCENAFDQGSLSGEIGEFNIVGGEFIGGNFWDDYLGSDDDENGIGDTPHLAALSEDGGAYQDNLPLSGAAVIIVNIHSDESDADPNDGVPDIDLTQEGLQTSLRAAIEFANALEGRQLIQFDADLDPNVNIITQGVTVTDSVRIESDSILTFIQAQSSAPALRFASGASNSSIDTLTFVDNVSGAAGEVIRIDGARNVTIKNCIFRRPVDNERLTIRVTGNASVMVTGCTFRDGGSVASIRIEDSSGSVIGEDNIFDSGPVVISGTASMNNNISDNTFSNLGLGETPSIFINNAPGTEIAGNRFENQLIGITLLGAETTDTQIVGNNFFRSLRSANSVAVLITEGANGNTVGGSEDGEENTIDRFAVGVGVVSGQENSVRGNIFLGNQPELAIDLAYDVDRGAEPTPNDDDTVAVPDTAANRLQNTAELVFLLKNLEGVASGVTVLGILRSRPLQEFEVDVYTSLGQRPEAILVTTDLLGIAVFRVDLDNVNGAVMFTATDRDGNTSESSIPSGNYVVNSTVDPGDLLVGDGLNTTGRRLIDGALECSLRAAIEDGNALAARFPGFRGKVFFQIPGDDAEPVIILGDALDFINFPITLGAEFEAALLDRFESLGIPRASFDVNASVELDGELVENLLTPPSVGFRTNSAITIRNMAITGFKEEGVRIEETNDSAVVIEGCRISGNLGSGISILQAQNVRIGGDVETPGEFPGNIIGGNPSGVGILIEECPGFRIKGNLIGVLSDGELSPNLEGVRILSNPLVDGNLSVIENNIIGGNTGNGVFILDSAGVHLRDNRIGMFSDELAAPNGRVVGGDATGSGVVIAGSSADNVIGGSEEGQGNFIAANVRNGIAMLGGEATLNAVLGNTVGDPFADGAFSNGEAGILIDRAQFNRIGGAGAEGNLIVENGTNGLEIVGTAEAPARENFVFGNRFQTNPGAGILIRGGIDNVIGGAIEILELPAIPNRFNAGNAIAIHVVDGLNNFISENSIFNNLSGIVLEDGTHGNIRPPEIVGIAHDGARLRIDVGIFVDTPGGEYRLEVFQSTRSNENNVDCDQGEIFVGARTLSFDSAGATPVTEFFDLPNPTGNTITTTVYVDGRGTSEFSNCFGLIPNDADGDGASEELESQAIDDGDFNDNGIPDVADPLVTAVQGFNPAGQPNFVFPVAIDESGVRVRRIRGIPVSESPLAPPPGVEFPFGLVEIELGVSTAGDTVTITIPIPAGFTNINCFYKLLRRTQNGPLEWVCYDRARVERDRVIIELTDGEIGDLDLILNQIILDPGALAFDPSLPPITSPANDVDDDGLPDSFESQFFGSDTAANPGDDSDGDGTTELEEFIYGTDPTDASDRLVLNVSHDGESTVITFNSRTGRTYSVQSSEDLQTFSDLASDIAGTGDELQFEESEVPPARFYRLRVELP